MRSAIIAGAGVIAGAAVLAVLVDRSFDRLVEREIEFEDQTGQIHQGMAMSKVVGVLGLPAERPSGPDMDDSCRAVNAASQLTYVLKHETWVHRVLDLTCREESRFIICADQNGNVLRTQSMLMQVYLGK
jgi:hypothetical protein